MVNVVEFPDDIDMTAGLLTLTLADHTKTVAHNVSTQTAKLQAQLAAANATIAIKQDLLESANRYIAKLEAENAALKAGTPTVPPVVTPVPPVSVPGKPVKPTITKTLLANLYMLTITKDDTPSPTQDGTTRKVLDAVPRGVFNVWRGYLSPEEVRRHLALPPTERFAHLVRYGEDRDLLFMADTVDLPASKLNDDELQAYLNGLKTIGAKALYLNDWFNYGKQQRIDMVKKLRQFSDLPIIASIKASDNRADFTEVDHVEIQCFGSLAELEKFLKRTDVQVWCLDGRKSADVDYQKKAGLLLVRYGIDRQAWYTARERNGSTDWADPAMLPQVTEISKSVLTVQAMKLVKPVAPLTA